MRNLFLAFLVFACPLISVGQESGREPYLDSLGYAIDCEKDTAKIINAYDKYIKLMDDAEAQYESAIKMLDLATQYGDSSLLWLGYQTVGFHCSRSGRFKESLEYTFKALEIAQQLHNNNNIALCLLNLGSYFAQDINVVDESVKYYSLAINVAESDNNYAVLELIYYDLAILYMEREIFAFSVDYFQKSLDAHIKSGNSTESDIIEYDLTIKLNRMMLLYSRHQNDSALMLLDSINTRMADINKIDNFAGQANLSMGMCDYNLKALKICQPSRYDNYLENAKKFLDMLDTVIINYNVQWLRQESYNNLYSQYLMAKGDYVTVRPYIMSRDSVESELDYNRLLITYYNHTGDFRKVAECMHYERTQSNKVLSAQSAANYENLNLQMRYHSLIGQIEKQAKERNSEYERSHTFFVIVVHLVAFTFLVMVAIILSLIRLHNAKNREKEILEKSNGEIRIQNSKLNQMQEEYLAQNDEILSQNHIIESQRDKLAEINHSLRDSIDIAANIQRAAIYDEQTLRDNIGDCFVVWKPLFKVSGDFYWASRLGDKLILFAADCTGHGVPGALLSMYGISMLNDYVRRNLQYNAAEILDTIKAAFMEQFVRGDRDFVDGMDCALVIFSRKDMTVDYAGARRPLIKISDDKIYEYRPDKICIGNNLLRDDAKFTDQTLSIKEGDMLYVFSDGIADQFGDDDCSTKFGNRQLKEILAEVAYLDTSLQKAVIESVVENWMSGPYHAGIAKRRAPQLDDQLLIGVRV
ncbi:MAG: SpoIIE family protein phosphatase [Bacteroidales bacterium]|nr:SpoIIE family protein phosphatase [Bacteroidales bacterium]